MIVFFSTCTLMSFRIRRFRRILNDIDQQPAVKAHRFNWALCFVFICYIYARLGYVVTCTDVIS